MEKQRGITITKTKYEKLSDVGSPGSAGTNTNSVV